MDEEEDQEEDQGGDKEVHSVEKEILEVDKGKGDPSGLGWSEVTKGIYWRE